MISPAGNDTSFAGPSAAEFSTRDAMLEWVQDIAPYGIFTTDAHFVIRSWNRWLVTHSGLSAEAVIGRPLVDVFPELATRRGEEHFRRALRGEVSVLSTALHKYLLPLPSVVREFGVDRMLQTARVAPLAIGERIVGTVAIIEDVTQRECQAALVRRQQEFDRLLSEALGLLLEAEAPMDAAAALFPRIAAPLKLEAYFNYLYDAEANELRLHSSAGVPLEMRKTMTRISVGQGLCGRVAERRAALAEFHLREATGAHAAAAQKLGLRAYVGFPLILGDQLLGTLGFGSYQHDSIPAEVVEVLGKVSQYLAIALDRARREAQLREAQRRLSEHASELERKVAQRTAKLHETITQLESFSYTVAHDLRAPIRSLTGYTEVLLSDFAHELPSDAQLLVQRLNRSSHRLDVLTRDLLKFSRIAREDVKLAPVDVDELVEEIVAVTPALQRGVLTVEGRLGWVLAQRTLLQQCFSNLFDNALKFTAPGVAPRIVLQAEWRAQPQRSTLSGQAPFHSPTRNLARPAAGPRCRLWVQDNGIGIPAHAHERVFGIFERVPGPHTVDGTGIGLAIVARATEQMGGTCGVESHVGHGSRFWIELAPAPVVGGSSSEA